MSSLRKFIVTAGLLIAAAGCSSSSSSSSSSSDEHQPSQAAGDVTYYKDIKPILEESCVKCHQAGGITPFEFTSYDRVFQVRGSIEQAVTARTMPPWLAAPGCADYVADPSLSDAQISLISEWISGGAPAGDPSGNTAPEVKEAPQLSRIDVSLKFQDAYTPKAASDGDYRCFVFDWPREDVTYVTGFGARPEHLNQVHHLVAYLASPERAADLAALDAADPEPGYSCYGGTGTSSSRLDSWAPGRSDDEFPAGTGIKVLPGSKVVVQIHYSTLFTEPKPDRPGIVFRLDSAVEKEAVAIYYGDVRWLQPGVMMIPAGQSDVKHGYVSDVASRLHAWSDGVMSDNEPFLLHFVGHHMHTRGKRARIWIERAGNKNETECALDVPRWDFDWQLYYRFNEPKLIQPGDKIGIECTWDNSTGRTDLEWGEGTNQEMCVGILYMTRP